MYPRKLQSSEGDLECLHLMPALRSFALWFRCHGPQAGQLHLEQEGEAAVPVGDVAPLVVALRVHKLHDDTAQGREGLVDEAGLLEVLPGRPGRLVPLRACLSHHTSDP